MLVARSADKLEEIKKDLEAQYGINVKVIAKGTVQRPFSQPLALCIGLASSGLTDAHALLTRRPDEAGSGT